MKGPNAKKRKTSHDQNNGRNDNQDDIFTSKPTAVFTPKGGRSHTLSIAIPGSIVANCHSVEQKSFLAGSIARALAVFCVDEVIIFDDDEKSNNTKKNYNDSNDANDSPMTETKHQISRDGSQPGYFTAYSDPSHYLAHLLSYLETPPYLRKHLFPMHPNLRTAGLLPSLDMPHHLRANEWCDYRDGVAISETVVDTGLPQKVNVTNEQYFDNARVTVRFSSQDEPDNAEAVDSSAPRMEAGYYWGYSVRRCGRLSSVFEECPFDGGYDLSFGTSERGAPLTEVLKQDEGDGGGGDPGYKHLLIIFGGVAGLETAVRNDHQLREMGIRPTEAEKLFDHWVNILPGQGSRTIRTEEAVWLGLTGLRGLVEGTHRLRGSS